MPEKKKIGNRNFRFLNQPLSHINTLFSRHSQLVQSILHSHSYTPSLLVQILCQLFLKMFSLRIVARSARLSVAIPSASKSQALIAARYISSATRVPRLSTPNFFGRRNYTDEASSEISDGPGQRFALRHRGPDGAPLQPTDTLYVGNMQFDTTEQDLQNYFTSIGQVKGVKIIHDIRGLSKGFGYVQFEDLDTAVKACEQLNNTLLNGRRLNVQYLARPQVNKMGPNPPSKTLFIGNMNYEMTDDDINELFKDIKNCLDVRVAMDRRTGQPRGFAHADFADVESAQVAKEKLQGRFFFGRALRVDFSASDRVSDRPNESQ